MGLLDKIKQARDKVADGLLYDSFIVRNASLVIDSYLYTKYGIHEPIAKDIQFGLTVVAIASKMTEVKEFIKHPLTNPFQKLSNIVKNFIQNVQFSRSFVGYMTGRGLIYGAENYPEATKTVVELMGQNANLDQTNLDHGALVAQRKGFELIEEFAENKVLEKRTDKEKYKENQHNKSGNQQLETGEKSHSTTINHQQNSQKDTTPFHQINQPVTHQDKIPSDDHKLITLSEEDQASNEFKKIQVQKDKQQGRFKPKTKEDRLSEDQSLRR